MREVTKESKGWHKDMRKVLLIISFCPTSKRPEILEKFHFCQIVSSFAGDFSYHDLCVLDGKGPGFCVLAVSIHRVLQKSQELLFIDMFITDLAIKLFEDLHDDLLLAEIITELHFPEGFVEFFLASTLPVDFEVALLLFCVAGSHMRFCIYNTGRSGIFLL